MELCLGTVQFGTDYGIQGGSKPTKDVVFEILDYAFENGITTLDTASVYGDAESIIGIYNTNTSKHFDIISKLPYEIFKQLQVSAYANAAKHAVSDSLTKLKVSKLSGLLFHEASYLYDQYAVDTLRALKELGYTDRIGVSVYEPKDAEYALSLNMDIVQIPNNLFDRRFDMFLKKVDSKISIFARSVYLQGLLLMDLEEISKKLPGALQIISSFEKICEENNYSRREIALSYIKNKKGIHSLIFGVDNMNQLKENIAAYQRQVPLEIVNKIFIQFENVSEDIVSPLQWWKLR